MGIQTRLLLQSVIASHSTTGSKIQGRGYIVYALTRQVALAHAIQVVPEAEVERQKQVFQLLIKQLG